MGRVSRVTVGGGNGVGWWWHRTFLDRGGGMSPVLIVCVRIHRHVWAWMLLRHGGDFSQYTATRNSLMAILREVSLRYLSGELVSKLVR